MLHLVRNLFSTNECFTQLEKTKGPEQAPSFLDIPGSSRVSKRPRGHTKLTPVTAPEEKSRESR